MKPDYDTTLARIAGTIAAGLVPPGAIPRQDLAAIADTAVDLARLIVARVRETAEPPTHPDAVMQEPRSRHE